MEFSEAEQQKMAEIRIDEEKEILKSSYPDSFVKKRWPRLHKEGLRGNPELEATKEELEQANFEHTACGAGTI